MVSRGNDHQACIAALSAEKLSHLADLQLEERGGHCKHGSLVLVVVSAAKQRQHTHLIRISVMPQGFAAF